ncbi:hypothetical protein BDR07DRAFT_481817 [Suillus spraguei]|nr:hypothetical protein BDR07DRAFT_481817 [Suillus spraguei]
MYYAHHASLISMCMIHYSTLCKWISLTSVTHLIFCLIYNACYPPQPDMTVIYFSSPSMRPYFNDSSIPRLGWPDYRQRWFGLYYFATIYSSRCLASHFICSRYHYSMIIKSWSTLFPLGQI